MKTITVNARSKQITTTIKRDIQRRHVTLTLEVTGDVLVHARADGECCPYLLHEKTQGIAVRQAKQWAETTWLGGSVEWTQSGNRITSDTVLTDGVGARFTPEELVYIRAAKIEVPPCR